MNPTAKLSPNAQEFWDRHAERLTACGILTENDLDAFTLLAQTWARVQELAQALDIEPGNFRAAIQYTNTVKQFERLAGQFGILPRVRRASKMKLEAAEQKDPFGL